MVFSKLIDLAGWVILIFMLMVLVMDVVSEAGGVKQFLNMSAQDPDYRNRMIEYSVAYSFLTPLYRVNILGFDVDIPLDGFGMFIVAVISFLLTAGIVRYFELSFVAAIPLFLVVFLFASTIYTITIIHMLFEGGHALGLDNSQIWERVESTRQLTANPWVLTISLFTIFFIFLKGRGVFV